MSSTRFLLSSIVFILRIAGVEVTPYRPGFSTWSDENVQFGYKPIHTVYSAGVDCGGFVQRVIDYNGNHYTTPNMGDRLEWGVYETIPNLLAYDFPNYLWHMPINNPTSLVPGDILYSIYYYPDGSNIFHVTIVWSIVYNNDSRDVREANVTVIESGGNDWSVQKRRTWLSLIQGGFRNFVIGRLITDN